MHINSNDLNNFQNEEMNTDEIIAFLEHMKHCDYCLNQLADEYTDHASSAPASSERNNYGTCYSSPIFRYRKQQRMLPIKCGFSMRGSAL